MSRIGKRPISIPDSVQVSIVDHKILFKGAKTTKEIDTHGRVKLELRDKELVFYALDSTPKSRAFWGTYRALANNIIIGLTQGFVKVLEINGVGYKATIVGNMLELTLGFSHPIKYPIPSDVEMSLDKNQLIIKGNDKQQVGQIAAEIRDFRLPEPYKGKGIRYVDEIIIRKAGKTAKK